MAQVLSLCTGTLAGMHTTEHWRWRLTSPVTGKRVNTRHRMTAADAMAQDPTADPMLGALELRSVPDGRHEFQHTNAWRDHASTGGGDG
jgi:hypothetical protein